MTLKTFFEKFDQFAEAPGAVVKMRELVRYLAVTGKLVDQDPRDESGELLLKKINAERSVAVKARQISPMKPLPAVGDDELSCELQPGWAAARLIELVMEIQTGPFGSSLHKSDYQLGGTPVINPASLKNGQIVPIEEMAIGHATLKRLEVFKLCAGDIVMARRGEMGRCAIVTKHEEGWLCGTGSLVLRMPRSLHVPYLAMLIGAPMARTYLGGASVGTTMQNLNQSILAKMPVRVPPLAEQKRIVAKVDELMGLCDRLEAQQQEREEQAGKLARASLARFAEAPTPPNLDLLFYPQNKASPSPIIHPPPSFIVASADLRKSILTLAVQGKLVPQDPNDEAVENSVRAARKKARLSVRPLAESASGEAPFEAPESWRWVTVADVADTRLGKMLDKEKNRGEAHPYLRNTNVHWFRFELESIKTMLFASSEVDEYRVEAGDVLICEGGHGIARSAVWNGQIPGIMFQKALHRVRPLCCLDGHFLTFCLWVYERDEILQRYYTGAGIPHFTGRALARVTFPLPPLAEQSRIVAKVDQLMALVDALETQLAASRVTAAHLLSALVAELTRNPSP